MKIGWREVANLRAEVEPATDGILVAWSRWMREDCEEVTKGYPSKSAGFNSGGSVKSFDDLEDSVTTHMARAADVVIDGLVLAHRRSLAAIYCGGRCVDIPELEKTFLEAVVRFEHGCRSRGLL